MFESRFLAQYSLHTTTKKKSSRVRSEFQVGHKTDPGQPILWCESFWLSTSLTSKPKCGGAPTCWKSLAVSIINLWKRKQLLHICIVGNTDSFLCKENLPDNISGTDITSNLHLGRIWQIQSPGLVTNILLTLDCLICKNNALQDAFSLFYLS